jgi:recombination protein RecA
MHNPLSKEAKEVVLGTMLGDGCLFLVTGNRHYKLVLSHSPSQREYLDWKIKHFEPIATKVTTVRAWHKRNQKEYTHLGFTTSPLSYFTMLRKDFYMGNKKVVRRRVLNQLTPLAIATWFMDDGSTTKNNKGYPQLFLYTCSFSLLDHDIMKDYFKEVHGIETLIHCRKKHPRLYFNRPNGQKLVDLIRPYVIPSMEYKLRYFTQNSPIRSNAVEDIV